MTRFKLRICTEILLLSSALACSGGEAATVRGARGSVVDSSAGTVALGIGEAAYSPAGVTNGGSIVGTVRFQGTVDSAAPIRRDSIVAVRRDQSVCGDSASVTEIAAGAAGNALVWVDGINAGKALPELRRDRVVIENCRFEPRVMAVPVGTTVNIFSRDRVEHDAQFYREGAGEPIDRVRTFNAGSIVPSERIGKEAGIVEARSSRQPWMRGYIAVFNHPYYAVTDNSGAFTIEGLPTGTYTVKVWHEGLSAPTEQRVAVAPNGRAQVDVALPLR